MALKTRHIFWFWRDSLRISYCLIKVSDWFLKIVKSTHCRRVKKNYLRLLRLLFETFKITAFSENHFEIAFDNRLKGGTEAVAQTCFVKKVFLENSKSSLESTCARVSILIKLQVWDLQLYEDIDFGADVFLWIYEFFKNIFSCRTISVADFGENLE